MKLTFLGTGTSTGVPVAGGYTYDEPSMDPRDQRLRTSAWIETHQISVLIDAGPDFRAQTLRSGIKKIDLLLLTHEHTDHVAGLDDLRPFNYVRGSAIPTIASKECEESIRRRFYYMFEPEKTPGSVNLDFKTPELFKTYSYADLQITAFPVKHGHLPILGYKINNLVYITDASEIPEKSIQIIRGCKTLVINALRKEPKHPTHFTIQEALKEIELIQPQEAWFVHMNSQIKQANDAKDLPKNVHFAHDCLVIEF